jgi:hypothetical protein
VRLRAALVSLESKGMREVRSQGWADPPGEITVTVDPWVSPM